jgi:hypothetical protein
MIKSIQYLKLSLPLKGTTYNLQTAVRQDKASILVWGGNRIYNDESDFGWGKGIYPVPKLINSSQIDVGWSETPSAAGNIALIVIEYI